MTAAAAHRRFRKATLLYCRFRNVAFLNFWWPQSSASAALNVGLGRMTSSALALSTK